MTRKRFPSAPNFWHANAPLSPSPLRDAPNPRPNAQDFSENSLDGKSGYS